MNLNDDIVYRCLRLGPPTSFIPAVPAARSVTTIAFIVHHAARRGAISESYATSGLMKPAADIPGRAGTPSGIQSAGV
jgi:hypothetical protein